MPSIYSLFLRHLVNRNIGSARYSQYKPPRKKSFILNGKTIFIGLLFMFGFSYNTWKIVTHVLRMHAMYNSGAHLPGHITDVERDTDQDIATVGITYTYRPPQPNNSAPRQYSTTLWLPIKFEKQFHLGENPEVVYNRANPAEATLVPAIDEPLGKAFFYLALACIFPGLVFLSLLRKALLIPFR